jgi:hypothetical protein
MGFIFSYSLDRLSSAREFESPIELMSDAILHVRNQGPRVDFLMRCAIMP